jgi:ceramide glucosyltransferase
VVHGLLIAVSLVAGLYQIVAILAACTRRRIAALAENFTPKVSILKPAHGADPGFYDAIRTNAAQVYPEFEILFGVSNPADAAVPLIERLIYAFPNRDIRLYRTSCSHPNAKAGVLDELAGHATGDVILIADADILVPPGYLRAVVAPLADPAVGLVTCTYRTRAETWPARFEGLGVATDFAPSTMVAPFVGIDEFALGSTLAVRRADLERAGGIAAIGEYLADDYQLGKAIHALGLRCVLSEVVVETHLNGRSWRDVWRHQLRWARTIRVSRGGGYLGLPVTHAGTWALLAGIAGMWPVAALLIAVRYAMAFTAGWFVLRSSDVLRLWWLIPIRDLWASAVWAAGLFGTTVVWGGKVLRLTPDGRIVP